MSDGRVAVADQGAHTVYVLSRAGAIEQTLGREGEGPGEFKAMVGLVALGGDTLLVQDLGNQRLSPFSGGVPVGDVRFDVMALIHFRANPVLGSMAVRGRAPSGALLLVTDMGGYTVPPPDGWFRLPVLRTFPDQSSARPGSEGPVPLFQYVLSDPEGNAWIGDYAFFYQLPADSFAVVTHDGEWIGKTPMPPGFRPIQIGTDLILGIEKDAFDVQAVAAYAIEKGGVRQGRER